MKFMLPPAEPAGLLSLLLAGGPQPGISQVIPILLTSWRTVPSWSRRQDSSASLGPHSSGTVPVDVSKQPWVGLVQGLGAPCTGCSPCPVSAVCWQFASCHPPAGAAAGGRWGTPGRRGAASGETAALHPAPACVPQGLAGYYVSNQLLSVG